MKRIMFVALLLHSLSATAMAQSGTGAIGGMAQDESGALLPGVTITLVNPGTIGGNQAAVTDARGAYQFTRLVPGTYSVRGELQGFRTVLSENIVVNADVTSRVDFKLEVGAVSETLTVTGQSPLVDTTQALNQTVLDNTVVAACRRRNDIWAIGRTVPSVVMNKYEVGGTESYQNSRAWVHGAGRNEGMLSIDGMNISCFGAAGASPCTFVDPMTFQEVNFQTGNTSADNVAGGVSYNMVTRTGSNVFRGSYSVNGTNEQPAVEQHHAGTAPGPPRQRVAAGAGAESQSESGRQGPQHAQHGRVCIGTSGPRQDVVCPRPATSASSIS